MHILYYLHGNGTQICFRESKKKNTDIIKINELYSAMIGILWKGIKIFTIRFYTLKEYCMKPGIAKQFIIQ